MSWTKLDDQFFTHPKVIDLPKDAKLLYLSALAYCAGQLTDGLITPGALRVVAATVDVSRADAAELVSAGLWEKVDAGWQVHDYLEYQPTRDKALAIKQARAEAGSRGGHKSADSRAEANSQANAEQTVKQTVKPISTPSPSPSLSLSNPEEYLKKDTNTPRDLSRQSQIKAFCDFYTAYPVKQARQDAEKAWLKLSPDDTLREAIMAGLLSAKGSEEWHEDGGKYIPHPATFLNSRRWEDVYTSLGSRPVTSSRTANGSPRPCTVQGTVDDTARALRADELHITNLRQAAQLKGLLL